jgi:hypothetical protein
VHNNSPNYATQEFALLGHRGERPCLCKLVPCPD